jgi:pumilio RNA-binding family
VCKLVSEFQDKVLLFIHDPNGNHVIQRCIQVMSAFPQPSADDCDAELDSASSLTDQMQVIVDDIVANIELLSTHRYGCRVVQRAVEHCDASQKTAVLEHIVSCLESLIVDHYGEERQLSYVLDPYPGSLSQFYFRTIRSLSPL